MKSSKKSILTIIFNSNILRLTLIVLTASTLFLMKSFAAEASIEKIDSLYEDFKKTREEILTSNYTPKDFKQKFNLAYDKLQKKYDEVEKIEMQIKKDLFTPKGNQMAFDIEVITPLKTLADGPLNKQNCQKISDENERNRAPDVIAQVDQVQKIINQICKNIKK